MSYINLFFILFLLSCSSIPKTSIINDNNIEYSYFGTWVDSKGNIVLEIKNSSDKIVFHYDNVGIPIDSIIKKSNNEYTFYPKNNKNILLNVIFYSDIYSEIIIYMDNIVVEKLFLDKI